MSLSKKLDKLQTDVIEKILEESKDSPSALHKVVSDAEAAIIKATKERDANKEYQKAGETRHVLSSGLRAVKSKKLAEKALALSLLDEADDKQMDADDEEALDKARKRVFEFQQKRKKAEVA